MTRLSHPRTLFRVAVTAVSLVLACAGGAGAQLISPGKLSSAHSDLQGIRKCTQCHELRKQGISQRLCLACHTPLAEGMAAETGFHAALPDPSCALCHKEHFGPDFALVRLDTLSFEHRRAGYELNGSHDEVSCRACHLPGHIVDAGVRAFKAEHGALERTFLGLSQECASCHEADGPHGDQFVDRSCSECHDSGTWEEAPEFSHDRAGFPLTGEHRTVACTECHETTAGSVGQPERVRYVGVAAGRCNDCHEDRHRGAMPGPCAGCHTTSSWKDLDRRRLESSFDHGATGFGLEGRHAAAPCTSCHDARAARRLPGINLTFPAAQTQSLFPKPEAGGCLSCHEDEHRGAMPRQCETCHTTVQWTRVDPRRLASRFDHATTGYVLEGGHAALACEGCHDAETAGRLDGIRLVFGADSEDRAFPAPAHEACMSCHQDRHQGVFADSPSGPDCHQCHGQVAWVPAAFDTDRHNRETDFALDGVHVVVACVDCHVPAGPAPSFAVAGSECAACHRDADPHGDQFTARACDACHTTSAFDVLRFDHDRTRFPLEGAHSDAQCRACHVTETDPSGRSFVRYRPVGTECRDCHGGGA